MYLLAKFGSNRSYGDGDTNSYIIKNSPSRPAILGDFQNQEYRFTIPKSLTWLAEKQEKEEYRQLQSAIRLAQTQCVW